MVFHCLHRCLIVVTFIFYSLSVFAQSEKFDVEIHVADKEASIYIDGSNFAIGQGSTLYYIQLTQGKHTITATRQSYTKISKTVYISKDNYASRIIKLGAPKPIYGYLSIASTPSNLEVVLDGNKTGKYTPYVFDSILIGEHKITLSEVGYKDGVYTKTIEEADTARLDATLAVIEVTKPKENNSTSSYSSYSSGYSANSLSYHSSTRSSSYSPYNYEKKSTTFENQTNWRILYFGIGGAVGTNFSALISAFNIRYKYIEFRPLVWGVSGSIIKNLPHHKLPNILVHPEKTRASYYYNDYYEVAEPQRGAQWYYAPTLRVHIPIRGNYDRTIIFGAGPQISWTKIKWVQTERMLYGQDTYDYTYEPFPKDAYSSDGLWFTAEVAYNMQLGNHTDFEMSLRYQDGFVFGLEFKFGKSY